LGRLKRRGIAVTAQYVVFLIILLSLAACQRHDPAVEPLSKSEDPAAELKPGFSAGLEKDVLASLEAQLGVAKVLEGSVQSDGTLIFRDPPTRSPVLTGEWIEKGGSRFCSGYMARIEDEDYCVSEVPEDWAPFEFEGETYFVQPLSDDGVTLPR